MIMFHVLWCVFAEFEIIEHFAQMEDRVTREQRTDTTCLGTTECSFYELYVNVLYVSLTYEMSWKLVTT